MNILVLAVAASLSAGNAEFDRGAAECAARIAASRAASRVAENGIGAGALKKAMLGNPAEFSERGAAEKKCAAMFDALAREAYAAECEKIRRRLSLPDGFPLDPSPDEERGLSAKFASVFDAERREAVEAQATAIVAAVRPAEAEFETVPEKELAGRMVERTAAEQKGGVFEENLEYISEKIVKPVIEGAKAERRRQKEYVARAKSDAASPSRMAAEIEKRLRDNVAARNAGKRPEDVWGVFPGAMAEAIPAAVEKRVVGRLADEISSAKIEIAAKDVAAEIAKDPAAHAKRRESEKIFAAAYSASVLAGALKSCAAAAPEDERAELEEYLSARLASPEVSKAVERTVRREIMPKWSEARKEAAAAQTRDTWPALCDGTWFPDAEFADATAARSDYSRAVKRWREEAAMRALADAPGAKNAMEEASAGADALVAAAFDRARNAIAAQNAILDSSHAGVLAEARARKNSFWRRTPDEKAVAAMLTEAVERGWAGKRFDTLWPDGERPANADVQHAGIFPSVKRKIELLAKTIIEEMSEKEEKEETEEIAEEEELAFSLTVKREGAEVEVKLMKGGETISSEKTKAEKKPFEGAMERMSRRLSDDILKLR